MNLKLANFNISGGFYGGDEKTEYLDREAADSIDNTFLNEIINLINDNDLDVICFQEIVTTKEVEYIKKIKDSTSLKYHVENELSMCNLIKNTNCGVAILSKYPIIKHNTDIFTNPNLSKTTASGNTYYTFDKGYIVCELDINGKIIKVLTHHGFPYRRFNSIPEDNKMVFVEFDNIIKENKPTFITGDFNAENFMKMMEYTNEEYERSFNTITTVDGMKYDDILVTKGATYTTKMIKSLSDHYLVIININI